MKDYLLELAAGQTGTHAKLNVMREYLQATLLRIVQDRGVFRRAAFVGGTALRFLHGLPRFSEDLDFSLVRKGDLSMADLCDHIKREFTRAGYAISLTYNDRKAVQHAFAKFGGLMHEAGITPHRSQNLSIKIEIDTNPPKGAALRTEVVNKYFPISFLTHDVPSLFAGKLHALLTRRYAKGRDYFDLGWYLSRWKDLEPNIAPLQNALKQTGWKEEMPTQDTWRDTLHRVVARADWKAIRRDVENFLENPQDMNVFTQSNVLNLIRTR